jgi:hypothetical protein
VLTGEKECDDTQADLVEGKRSQVLGGGRLTSEEGGEAFWRVGARRGARAQKGD